MQKFCLKYKKAMTKILSTIGPISSDIKKIEFILKKSKILRLNMSHNSPHWHKKKCKFN